ncbi:SdpI family protein [Fulvivirga sp. RKSG066]|nr:SdpI family protein [Fulvivirga aurantia]
MVGPLMTILAIIFKAFPPKKINGIYGYRTKRSMRNQKTWDVANSYANNLMFWLFLGLSVVELPLFFLIKPEYAALVSCGLLTVGIIILITATEQHLKNKFG